MPENRGQGVQQIILDSADQKWQLWIDHCIFPLLLIINGFLVWCKQFGLVHISAGDLLRAEVASGSEAGRKAESFMKQGNLVPNELVRPRIVGIFSPAAMSLCSCLEPFKDAFMVAGLAPVYLLYM